MMIDLHTHILPGIDDGSRSTAMSLEMLQESKTQGISGIVLTPHFYANDESPDDFLRHRTKAYKKLKAAMDEQTELPVYLGAEILYFPGMAHSEDIKRLRLEGTRCCLVEFPMEEPQEAMLQELQLLQRTQGVRIIIAHAERYMPRFRIKGFIQDLVQRGFLVQVNASFFLHPFHRSLACKLLQQGYIHFLGSDCHNMTSRAPNMGEAMQVIEKKLGREALGQLSERAEQMFRQAGRKIH